MVLREARKSSIPQAKVPRGSKVIGEWCSWARQRSGHKSRSLGIASAKGEKYYNVGILPKMHDIVSKATQGQPEFRIEYNTL